MVALFFISPLLIGEGKVENPAYGGGEVALLLAVGL